MQELFALLFLLLPLLGNSVRVKNEICRPRPTLVAIDSPNYKYFPYFVKLHRCGGSCGSVQPSVKSCIPQQWEEVSVMVREVGTGKIKLIKERNHTKCGCDCVMEPNNCDFELEIWKPDTCQCQCLYGDKPPKPCEQGMTWNKNRCRCEHTCGTKPQQCGPNKVWSSKFCSCICKDAQYRICQEQQQIVDPMTCTCTNKMQGPETDEVSAPQEQQQQGGFRQEFYVVIFLGQFVVMYLVFDAILYSKKAGLIYRLTRSCSSKERSSKGDHLNMENSRENIFSESSITCTAVTGLPTETGENNMAGTNV